MLGWLKRRAEELFGRGSCWQRARAAHLRKEPRCRACGSDEDIEVHHITPYAVDESLECVESNLVTMCRPCHHVVGHAGNWHTYRPDVVSLCDTIRKAEVRRIVANERT